MRLLKRFSIFFLLLLFDIILFGQDPSSNTIGNVSIASPTAASLGKYADFPVSYHTGTPQIEIPIYTVKAGDLELPISLSYHPSGLKVQELASWVGAGWALNAGGVVTRSVMGLPDDIGFSGNTQFGHWTNHGFNSYLTYNGAGNPYDAGFLSGQYDGEPDMYFFNFGKYTGKFYFKDDRTPIMVPQQDFQIIPDSGYVTTTHSSGNVFRGFTIIPPDGNKYYFGATLNNGSVLPVEVTGSFDMKAGLTNGAAISSWYLNKIVSRDRVDSIMFNYTQENYSFYTLSMIPLNNLNFNYQSNQYIGSGSNAPKYDYAPIRQLVDGVRLSSIVFPTGQVNFGAGVVRTDLAAYSAQMAETANTTATSLGSISISNNGSLCKKFNFSYSFLTDNVNGLNGQLINWIGTANIQSDKNCLQLNSVQEVSCDNSIQIPPYTFTYFTESIARKLSFSMDHWGFNNGVTTNDRLIPTYTINGNVTVTGANRDASWPAMRGGALQQINYPTGGYTNFNFESHNVSSQQTSLVTATLAAPVYGMYGQGVQIESQSFLINVSTNPVNINFSSNSNYSASIAITNSSNATVFTYGIPNWSGSGANLTASTSVTLSPGSYTVTLTPGTSNYASVTGGVSVTLTQVQSQTVTVVVPVGGLRIKSITNYDPVSTNTVVTNFGYTNSNGTSSCTLYSVPLYVAVLRNDVYGQLYPNCPTITGNGCFSAPSADFLISPSSVRPMITVQGNHIGYDNVTVSQTGNGYSNYQYYDDYNSANNPTPWVPTLANGDVAIRAVNNATCNNVYPSYPYAPVPFNFMTGELKYEAHYNQAGQLLKDISYSPVYTKDPEETPGLIERNLYLNTANGGGPVWFTEYHLYSASKTQDVKIETNYDPVNGTKLSNTYTTNYASVFHHQPTQKTALASNGDLLTTNIKYTNDYRVPAADAYLADQYNTYNTNIGNATSIMNSGVAQYIYSNPCASVGTNQATVYATYRVAKANARVTFINSNLGNFSNFTTQHNTAKTGSDAQLKPILELQDENDNSAIETSNFRNSNLLSAAFTRYDYFNNTASVLYPYPQSELTLSIPSPSPTFTVSTSNGSTVTKDSRYATEDTYHFNGGRIADVTKKDGVTNSYIWGYNNQYPVAKIVGTSYAIAYPLVIQSTINNISTTDAAMRMELNKLRTGLSTGTNLSLVNTYTYALNTGMTSETDLRGFTKTYEYDLLGRELRARDKDGNILKQLGYSYNVPQSSTGTGVSGFMMTVVDNNSIYTGYTIQLMAVTGGSSATLTVGSHGTNSLGPVVPGVYNILITPPPVQTGGLMAIISISGSSQYNYSGSTVTINSITLGASNYNTINIY